MKIKAKLPAPKLKAPSASQKAAPGKSLEQIEIQDAVRVYLRECGVGRFSFFKRKALYERPWYLVIGPEGSGKSSLFTHSGIDFPVVYPSAEDGYIPGESTQPSVVWWFGHEAVWLDLPGRLFLDANKTLFSGIIASLRQVRPRCPVNGILLVVPCTDIVNGDADETRELAAQQRKIVEQLMHAWGVELPIYLIFSRTDEVPGFNELFSDKQGRWDERVLGASIESSDAQRLPRISFIENYEPITASLHDIRLRMLAKEKNEDHRGAMCRFPIDIAAMREKAALFIATLFKQGAYQARARFGGFFFTSCQNVASVRPASDVSEEDFGAKLLNHPLNPHKKAKRSLSPHSGSKKEIQSFFVRPLFTTIIPGRCAGVNITSKRFRKDLFSLLLRSGVAALVVFAFAAVFLTFFFKVRREEQKIDTLLTTPVERSVEGLEKLNAMDSLYTKYQNDISGMPPFHKFVIGYDVNRTHGAIGSVYRKKCFSVFVDPLIALLEESISQKLGDWRVSFQSLKNDLRAYCIITDQRLKYPEVMKEDSLAVVTLHSLTTENIIPWAARPGYDTLLTKLLQRSLCFINESRAGKDLPVADTLLVSQAQERLVRMMDNREIYSMILSREKDRCRDLDIKEIIPDAPYISVLKNRRRISEAYTPELWQKRLISQFKLADAQRKSIERWITGDYASGLKSSAADINKQLKELIGFYLEDVTLQWRDFLSSVNVDAFASPDDAEKIFRQLCAKKSPLLSLIQSFAGWAGGFSIEDSTLPPLEDLYRKFAKQNGFYKEFADGYSADYTKKIEALADGLSKAREERSFALTFNGSDQDPLVDAWRFLDATIEPLMQDASAASLKPLLFSPIADIRERLADPVRQELNEVWENRVHKPFIAGFAKKYPFSDVKNEASLEAACSFFQPTHGPLWNVLQQYFSHRVAERTGQWVVLAKPGMVPLKFSPRFIGTLRHAKSITAVFYDASGTRNQWTIAVTASPHALAQARISIDNAAFPLEPGLTATLVWPKQGVPVSGMVNATDLKGNKGMLPFSGPWSVMKLMNESCFYEGSNPYTPNFSVKWKLRANAIELPLPARVTVSGSGHPFCINVFSGFTVPERAVE